MKSYEYFKPRTLREAFGHFMEWPGAMFIAGGTDLLVQMKNREISPTALVSLRSVEELGGVEIGKTTRLGSMTTVSDVIDNRGLCERFPILAEAALHLGSPQIRSVATIGGNICNGSPCADMALALLALEARVCIESASGKREVPLDEYFLGPKKTCLKAGEIMTGVLLDPMDPGAESIFMEKGRVMMDIATASLAVIARISERRVEKVLMAAGSVAPVPLRLKTVERALEGKILDTKVIARARSLAEKAVNPITDIRSTADYRRHMIGVFLERSLLRLAGRDGQ